MVEIFLSYIGGLLVCILGVLGGLFWMKKEGRRFFAGPFFIGIIAAVAVTGGGILLFGLLFKGVDYYNTVFFRTLVGSVILILICALRFLLIKSVFFNRYKEDQGVSFSLGIGLMPSLFLGVYLLIMSLVLAGNCLFNGPSMIADGYLTFADNTIISIFQPVLGHLSFSLAFFFYSVMVLCSSKWMEKMAVKRYAPVVLILWTVLLCSFEGIGILLIPFMKMYGLSHWHLLLIFGIFAVLSVLLIWLAPSLKEKETIYTKQFE